MFYKECHAAKDFQRKAQISIDDLVYAFSLARSKKCQGVFQIFSEEIIPILRMSLELTEFILEYSVYEPLKRLAESVEKEIKAEIEAINHARGYCSGQIDPGERLESYIFASDRICERMIEDMKMAEISERLGCDYLRYMICLTEGAIRLSEAALMNERCTAAIPVLRANSRKGREMLRSMGKLLAVTG